MPAMANLTVKKADGTTDIVWTALSPSAGDKVPAIWRSQTVGAAVAFRPEFRLWSYGVPSGLQRAVKSSLVYPILQVDGTVTKVIGYCTQVTETKLLLAAPDADAGEAVYQGFNLVGHASVKQAVKEGFSFT